MTTKYVQYCTRTKLECSAVQNAEVVLCLQDAALLAEVDCPLPSDATYENTFVEATICQFYQPVEGCCPQNYQYTFAYDDAVLADVDTPLQSSDIAGVFCRDCETEYTDYKAGSEVYIRTEEDDTQTLVSQHGCEYPIVAGGGGGACVNEVTTLEFNTAIGAGTLEAGCTYIITDHSQGRVPAGTRIILQAVAGDSVNPQCGVVTSYDSNAWAGWYDVTTNKLLELKDNLGNVCRQFPDTAFGPFTCVDDFDWGNPAITNCLVDNGNWYITYGVAPGSGIDGVRITSAGILDMLLWTGEYIYNLEISGFSLVDISGGNAGFESVKVINNSVIDLPCTLGGLSPDTFIFDVVVDTGFIVANNASSYVFVEGSTIANYGGIYHNGTGGITVSKLAIESEGEFRVAGTVGTSSNDVFIGSSTISDFSSIRVTGAGTGFGALVEYVQASGESLVTVACGTGADTFFRDSEVRAKGTLSVDSGSTVENTLVSQSTLNSAGFNLSGVYSIGVLTTTATANNTNTGRDYFNNSII